MADENLVEIKTENDHVAKFKPYITGGDQKEYQKVAQGSFRLRQNGVDQEGNPQFEQSNEVSGDLGLQLRDKALEITLVELDGDDDNLVERVENLPVDDYEEIVEKAMSYFLE